MSLSRLLAVIVLGFFTACSEPPKQEASGPVDIFSYANFNQVAITHIDLDLAADFENKVLHGTATLTLDVKNPDARELILDDRDLDIKSVEVSTGGDFSATAFTIGERDPVKGQSITIALPEGAEKVRIAYVTDPGATGLQWLDPAQTAGKRYPFMFSQSQSIHARSWVPLQDTPAVRFTYSAHIKTPPDLMAVMSAEQDVQGVRDGDYTFEMPQAIPSYLMAIAVGDLEFRAISNMTGVYGEASIVDAAAREFEDTPAMIAATEALYGPYRWGRYDLLMLPPSYPYGGMENPRLTFLTPTVIAGDKSMTNIIAHELAHSWAGNQVTNATWREPWLNEGITSYVENRVMEAVYGRERAVMEQVLSQADWMTDLGNIENPALTALKLPEHFDDPDEGFTDVAYIKGQNFMIFLEQSYGRDVFDPWLRSYFDHFAFHSITTEDFYGYLKENLMDKHPGVVADDVIREWLYAPGVPPTTPNPVSPVFEKIDGIRTALLDGTMTLAGVDTSAWSTNEWLYFLNGIPDDLGVEHYAALDQAFDLTHTGNAEIAFAWYMKSLGVGYDPVMEPLKAFLIRVGRGKFIYPLYRRLIETGHRDWAEAVFEEARPGYHPIAQNRVDAIFANN